MPNHHKIINVVTTILLGISFLSFQNSYAQEIDPWKLLKAVDDNLWSNTKIISGRLSVDNGRRVRTMSVDTWMEGLENSYSFYKSPAREKGTQMLKIKNKLWLYTPRTDRKILIAGHLLRQSMMGSDLSYEDMLEDRKMSISYDVILEKWEEVDGVRAAVLYLTAKDKEITYQSRRVWVEPKEQVVLKEERYAKSGKLLKRVTFEEYKDYSGRLFPKRMIFRDMLKNDTKTIYHFDEIQFDTDIPKKYFRQSILKR
jgi:outer membrane lipoprotein-sorting protein